METQTFTFEIMHGDKFIDTISVEAYEDNASWIATLRLHTKTAINMMSLTLKQIQPC